jgi:type II secretory pathway pseudopilin PulG
VIGTLITIALPSFLTARSTTQDRTTQAQLNQALVAANAAYADIQTFASFNALTMSAVETSLKFVDNTANGPSTVGVFVGTCSSLPCLSLAMSASNGNCWFVVQNDNGTPLYGKGSPAGGACDARNPTNLSSAFPT